MPRLAQFIVFFGIVSCIVGGLHWFAFSRTVRALELTGHVRTATLFVFWLLFLTLMAALPLSRILPRTTISPVSWIAFTWFGSLALLVVCMFFAELARPVVWLAMRLAPPDPGRREFLGRIPGLMALVAATFMAGYARFSASRKVRIHPVEVKIGNLPASFDGFRIVQLTDLHVGAMLDGEWLKVVVEEVNALDADIVAITGDLVDGSVETLRKDMAVLSTLKSKQGVFFVTGNHEYFSGADEWVAHLKTLGIKPLRNERVSLKKGTDTLELAGVDDWHSSRMGGKGADLPKALEGRDPEKPVILLAHQPAAVLEAAQHSVDLQLSGHTHGGQIWPWRYFVRLQQPYVSGLHHHPGGKTQIFVSNGTGYWGPPMRLGAPAEITSVVLHPRMT